MSELVPSKHKMATLERINEKLAHLGWVTVQIAGERDIDTIYHIIVNGFEQILGVSRCGFMQYQHGGFKPVVVKNCQALSKPVLCDGLLSAFNAVIHERVKIISRAKMADPEFYCCDEAIRQLNVCTIYRSNGKPLGVLFACGRSDLPHDTLLMVMELYSMQMGLIIENAVLNRKLITLTITDSLTGLYNHRHFYECMDKELGYAHEKNKPLTLLFIDVDYFKKYNDTYGHLEGDKALMAISDIIKKTVADSGQCFRFGGEEIAVILPGVSMAQGINMGWHICQAVNCYQGGKNTITVSVGVATYQTGMSVHELIKLSDESLYKAKSLGRNTVYPKDCV